MFPKLTLFLLSALLIISALFGLSGCTPAQQGLYVENGQIRALLPGRDTTAGYFTLHNETKAAFTLVGASSSVARSIEMHKTVTRGDSLSMQRVRQLTIAPGETVKFEPGGLHLMIFGVEELPSGIPITLEFGNGEQLTATFSKLAL